MPSPSSPVRNSLSWLAPEGLELIMWLVMRGAIGDSIRRVADTYFVPASNTAAGAAVFERV